MTKWTEREIEADARSTYREHGNRPAMNPFLYGGNVVEAGVWHRAFAAERSADRARGAAANKAPSKKMAKRGAAIVEASL